MLNTGNVCYRKVIFTSEFVYGLVEIKYLQIYKKGTPDIVITVDFSKSHNILLFQVIKNSL